MNKDEWLSIKRADKTIFHIDTFIHLLDYAQRDAIREQTAIVLINRDGKDYVLMTRQEFELLHGDIYPMPTLGEVTGHAGVDDMGS